MDWKGQGGKDEAGLLCPCSEPEVFGLDGLKGAFFDAQPLQVEVFFVFEHGPHDA